MMSTTMNSSRMIVILLFAITFMMIGWVAPVMYSSYAPSDDIIEQHKFTAQDVQTDAEEHYICFDRTVHQPASGETLTELYMVSDTGSKVEVKTDTQDRYFQSGRKQVVTPLNLPSNLQSGEYRYLLVVKLELVSGRVSRTVTFTSQTFTVSENVEQTSRNTVINNC